MIAPASKYAILDSDGATPKTKISASVITPVYEKNPNTSMSVIIFLNLSFNNVLSHAFPTFLIILHLKIV